jgi:hypothetical protein
MAASQACAGGASGAGGCGHLSVVFGRRSSRQETLSRSRPEPRHQRRTGGGAQARQSGPMSVSAPEAPSIIDKHVARAIDDVDESPRGEVERGLRHHGQPNRNPGVAGI